MKQSTTRFIMILSAIFLATMGLSLTFLPTEIGELTGINPDKTFTVILQIVGALYFSFAMLNWMAKGTIIGGIYNKPVSIANLTHFVIGGLALIKLLLNNHELPYPIWILAGIYTVFAVLFGVIFSKNPVAERND
ncbi:hypothetical protein ACPPVU_09400 [Mucilaginibacter sp. McL0603]|uniref:hypothetical protein n=1 Tax=Mucilaginibacter sp. McL0603 TaxID=3415670 RepID=UPI003CF435B2